MAPGPRGPTYLELEAYLKWMYAQYEWTDDAWVEAFAPTLPDNAKVLLARPEQDVVRWQQWQAGNTWTDVMVVTPERVDLAPDLTSPEITRQFLLGRQGSEVIVPNVRNEVFVTEPGVIDYGGGSDGGGAFGGM